MKTLQSASYLNNQESHCPYSEYGKWAFLPRIFDTLEVKLGALNLDRLSMVVTAFLGSFVGKMARHLVTARFPHSSVGNALPLVAVAAGTLCFVRLVMKPPFFMKRMEQIIAQSVGRKKNALILQSTDDPLGALSKYSGIGNARNLAQEHSIDLIVAATQTEFLQSLRSLPEKKYDTVWINSHGSQHCVEDLFSASNLHSNSILILNALGKRLKQGSKLILLSCQTGKGEENVAKFLSSRYPGVSVYAPSWFATSAGTEIAEDGTTHFYGDPLFRAVDITKTYCTKEKKTFWSSVRHLFFRGF